MKLKLILFSALLLSCAISFAQPVMPHQPMTNSPYNWYNQPQAPQSLWEKGLSLLGNDNVGRGFSLLSIGAAGTSFYLIKDNKEMSLGGKVGYSLLSGALAPSVAGTACGVIMVFKEIITRL
jgi:hypothetical protein